MVSGLPGMLLWRWPVRQTTFRKQIKLPTAFYVDDVVVNRQLSRG
jgi:hypothetical protein